MAETTGPVLAIGAITLGNLVIINERPMNWRIPLGTGVAAGMFALAEHAWPAGAKALAWAALLSVCFVRLVPGVPAPAESLARWWGSGAPPTTAKASLGVDPKEVF